MLQVWYGVEMGATSAPIHSPSLVFHHQIFNQLRYVLLYYNIIRTNASSMSPPIMCFLFFSCTVLRMYAVYLEPNTKFDFLLIFLRVRSLILNAYWYCFLLRGVVVMVLSDELLETANILSLHSPHILRPRNKLRVSLYNSC